MYYNIHTLIVFISASSNVILLNLAGSWELFNVCTAGVGLVEVDEDVSIV